MNNLFFVFIGGGLGALLRYGISSLCTILFSKVWVGTLIVNVVGSLIFILGKKLSISINPLFLYTGLLGALTTFSTFSFELLKLIQSGNFLEAIIVFLLNVIGGILIGIWILF